MGASQPRLRVSPNVAGTAATAMISVTSPTFTILKKPIRQAAREYPGPVGAAPGSGLSLRAAGHPGIVLALAATPHQQVMTPRFAAS
jgi:hypothetical protein